MARLEISVLGSMAITLDGEPVAGFEYKKVRALLTYLAVECRVPHNRDSIAALLWPGLATNVARRNLAQALTTLRLALGERTAGVKFVLADSDSIQLNPAGDVEVDLTRVVTLLDAAGAHPHRSWRTCSACAGRLRQAQTLYRGDFLADFFLQDSAPFEQWAASLRELLSRRMLEGLQRLVEWAEWRGQLTRAAEYARRQVELHPLLETGQRAYMRLLALSGQNAAALAQFEQLRRTLAQEMSLEPEAATAALYESIKAGHFQDRAPQPDPGLIPSPPTRLIGRQAVLQAVIEPHHQVSTRVLTVTGPPGVGKTRLALEAAAGVKFDFEDGVRFVELAPLSDPALVPRAVARVLDVKEPAGKSLSGAIAAVLRPQHMLLVLDNFEHVLQASAFVDELLQACPALHVLVTSRVGLSLPAEQLFPLSTLSVPDSGSSFEFVTASPAVQFFVERVQAVRAGFALTPENAGVVAEICARLDGLPLAMELIAAQARVPSPEALLAQLKSRLLATAPGMRDLPERQRTLLSAIAWSYDRLGAGVQRVFDHLGVFAGGFSLEAARAVAGAEDGASVQLALDALAGSSLIQAGSGAGETRYSLLETLREFALEQLTARGQLEGAQERHAGYFLALAQQAVPELIGPDQKHWLDRLDSEHANQRTALAWALSNAPETGVRLAVALAWFWDVRGYMREGRSWLNAALSLSKDAGDELRAQVLIASGRMAMRQGDFRAARELLTESHRLWARTENPAGLAEVLYLLGAVLVRQAEYAAAQVSLQDGLAIARSVQDLYTEAGILNVLSEVAMQTGDQATSLRLQKQALAVHQARGDLRNAAGMLLNLGVVTYELGEFDVARQYTESALDTGREWGDYQTISIALLTLGNILLAQNDPAGARIHLEEAARLHQMQHDIDTLAAVLGTLGRVMVRLGDLAAARAHQCEALGLRSGIGDRHGVSVSLRNLADLERQSHQPGRAARLLGASEAIREAIGSHLNPAVLARYEQLVSDVHAALGEPAFSQVWAEGRALSIEQAVALALENVPAAGAPGADQRTSAARQ
jgi:predicted ATPase